MNYYAARVRIAAKIINDLHDIGTVSKQKLYFDVLKEYGFTRRTVDNIIGEIVASGRAKDYGEVVSRE